jgi:hypothetical protein
MDSIALGRRELAEWAELNESAQKRAVEAGATLLLGRFVGDLDNLGRSVAAYKGHVTRNAATLSRKRSMNQIELWSAKLAEATRRYNAQKTTLQSKRIISTGLKAKDAWDLLTATFSADAQELARTNEDVAALLKDSIFANALIEIEPHADRNVLVAKQTLENLHTVLGPYSKLVGPAADFGSFVVGYGYAAAQYAASRQQIIDRYSMSDQDLRAVDSLKQQIELTVSELNACRAATVNSGSRWSVPVTATLKFRF